MAILTAMDVLLFLIFITCVIYYAIRRRYSYWKNKSVFGPEPAIPFGNIKGIITRETQFGERFKELYVKYKQYPYLGVYLVFRPALVVNDLDLIKAILRKDFAHFTDHGFPSNTNEEVEPLSGHLFNLEGEKWKNMRVKLTPTFTSSKMRNMFQILTDCALEMSEFLNENVDKSDVLEVKEILAKFGTDVIASCAFGIECKCFKNPDNKFRRMGRKLFESTLRKNIIKTINFFVPGLGHKLKLKSMGDEMEKFYVDLVTDTVNYRDKNGIKRNDFMQLLIQLKNEGQISNDGEENGKLITGDDTRLTILQIAAQAFVFFNAGFETSSTTASFALYELAMNPDVQETLIKEIDQVLEKHNGKITYDSLNEITYLAKVIEETLRKHPPLPTMTRMCTKNYTIPNTNIEIEKGTMILIPVSAIQRDPEIYAEPDKFDPERFSQENRESRHNFSFLPFGEGPRICIGSRFGLMQIKLGLVTILSNYTVSVCDKTLIPMRYRKKSFLLTSDSGTYLRFIKRS